MNAARRLVRANDGTVAVEFALLLPVLLLLLLGIFEFGRALWIRQTLQFAVESAARTALADSSLGGSAIAADVVASMPGLGNLAPQVTVSATAARINISASYDFTFLAPGLLPFGPITINAQSNTPR